MFYFFPSSVSLLTCDDRMKLLRSSGSAAKVKETKRRREMLADLNDDDDDSYYDRTGTGMSLTTRYSQQAHTLSTLFLFTTIIYTKEQ